jgi:hypothetical protein
MAHPPGAQREVQIQFNPVVIVQVHVLQSVAVAVQDLPLTLTTQIAGGHRAFRSRALHPGRRPRLATYPGPSSGAPPRMRSTLGPTYPLDKSGFLRNNTPEIGALMRAVPNPPAHSLVEKPS